MSAASHCTPLGDATSRADALRDPEFADHDHAPDALHLLVAAPAIKLIDESDHAGIIARVIVKAT